jgi:uncharacterized membrane protein YkoI
MKLLKVLLPGAVLALMPLAASAQVTPNALVNAAVQFLNPDAAGKISGAQADHIALAAVGGGRIVATQRDSNMGRSTWTVDIAKGAFEYEVIVDARSGSVLGVTRQRA